MNYLLNRAGNALAFSFMVTVCSYGQQPCLADAWTRFNQKDYVSAMQYADDCIDQFAARARREEDALAKNRTPQPEPTPSDAEKRTIFARGVLNDTGAAYFVKGRSAELLSRKAKSPRERERLIGIARQAYDGCKTLTYARTYEPKGWFWSTSEACSDRLQQLSRP